MSINTVSVSGNLTRDPELRYNANSTAFLNFGLAVNENRKNAQTGEWEPYANYFDCTAVGRRAEGLAKILTKGMKVAVTGKLSWRQWEADGDKRSKVSITVDEVDIMSGKRDNAGDRVAAGVNSSPSAPAPLSPVDNGEIPF